MKILMVSMYFEQDNIIGSIRPTNFANWLASFGHQVDVITNNPEAGKSANGNLKVYSFSAGLKAQSKENITGEVKNTRSPVHIPMLNGLRTHILEWKRSFLWSRNVLKQFPKAIVPQYDIIFSSYGPIGSYRLGRALYKKGYARHWISDMRDLMTDETWPGWMNAIYGRFQKQMVREADAITTPSEGIKNIIINRYCRNDTQRGKIFVITNGYEYGNIADEAQHAEDGILKFCYTGSLPGGRNMALLFQAMSLLIMSRLIDQNRVQVHYAGGQAGKLFSQAAPYHMERCIIDHGFVEKSEAVALQRTSDVLIVLSWNTENEQGILTGKFFEYIASDKPVIAITGGNVPDSELTRMVRDMKIGIACEYASSYKDLRLLEDYIFHCYECKMSNGKIPHMPDRQKIAEYRYDNLARKLEKLCLNILHSEG